MATGDDIRGNLRKLANAPANHEKCRARAMLVQEIEQRRRCGWIRTIVKRERDGAGIARSPPRRSE